MNTYVARFFSMVVIVVLTLTSSASADAPPGRYSVTAGTVYDTKTKLTWQQAVSTTTGYYLDAAKAYCAQLGTTLGGNGWRLPTRNELLTIVDYSRTNPAIDSTVFLLTPSTRFLSLSLLAGSPSLVWSVDFSNGSSDNYSVFHMYHVRCVHWGRLF